MQIYVRMKLAHWKDGFEAVNYSLPIEVITTSIGYLEVFDSKEEFEKLYPGEDYFVMEVRENK